LDASGNQAASGSYYVQVGEMQIGEQRLGPMNAGNTTGLDKILIEYPQGALEANLEPNLTVSADGVNITLDRAAFSASMTRIYTTVVPPDYHYPGERPSATIIPPISIEPFDPVATYRLGTGNTMDAGGGGWAPFADKVVVTWELDPVPVDAAQFTFTITSLDRWSGPWEFRFPLDAH